MKKLIVLFSAAFCLCAMNKANSQVVVASGTTGDCTWTLTVTGGDTLLTISGSGAMADYTGNSHAPWYSSRYNIKTLDIQQGVTTIGEYAFHRCTGLTGTLTIPNSVTTIGRSAFEYCSGLTGTLTIPNSVTTIGDDAFYRCTGLTGTLTIPNSVITIGVSSIRDCSGLTSVTIGNSVTSIGSYSFQGCIGLTGTLTIPNSVTTIGSAAFLNCIGLTSVIIGNSVTTIGVGSFWGCSGLTSVTIGNSVTAMMPNAFGRSGLTEIYVKATTPPSIFANTFDSVPTTIPVYVPCGTATAYQNASGWDYFTNIIEDIAVLSVQSSDNTMGTVNITRANTCADNTAVIEAVANAGYRFVQWNDAITQNPRTVTVTQDVTYTAEFAPVAATMFHVTVNVNNPSMGTVTGEGDYAENSTATIEAVANAGYRFVEWNDANTQNPRTITVTQDITYTATFEDEVGITELETSAVAVYPNPATDNITITLPENVFQAVFTLYDMQGRILIRRNITNEDVISVNEFAAGIYIYNVSAAKEHYQGKIVID